MRSGRSGRVTRTIVVACVGVLAAGSAIVAGMVAFGTARPKPPRPGDTALTRIDYGDLPPQSHVTVRDGTRIASRVYPGNHRKIALLIHGSTAHGRSMQALARFLAREGVATVYTIDVRGHGDSGERGHIRYVGQIDDDVADIIDEIRSLHRRAPIVLAAFSAGGGFAIRFATGPYAARADAYLFLAPLLSPWAPTHQPGYGGWAAPFIPRFIGLTILNTLGITAFNHLPVVAYSVSDEDARDRSRTYSWNLSANFRATNDYHRDFERRRQPAVLIVGRSDGDFRADAYGPDISPHAPKLPIVIVDGVDHLGLITQPVALETIKTWIQRLS